MSTSNAQPEPAGIGGGQQGKPPQDNQPGALIPGKSLFRMRDYFERKVRAEQKHLLAVLPTSIGASLDPYLNQLGPDISLHRAIDYISAKEICETFSPQAALIPADDASAETEKIRRFVLKVAGSGGKLRVIFFGKPAGAAQALRSGAFDYIDLAGGIGEFTARVGRVFAVAELGQYLAISEERHSALVENTPDGVFSVTPSYKLAGINLVSARIFNINPADALDREIEEVFRPAEAERIIRIIEEVKIEQGTVTVDHAQDTPDGKRVYQTSAAPVFDADGSLAEVIFSSRDITAIQDLLRDLQQASAEAIEKNRLLELAMREKDRLMAIKDGFMRVLSHDLRNPFSAILNLAQELASEKYAGSTGTGQAKLINSILSAARHELDILNDLMEYTTAADQLDRYAIGPAPLRPIAERAINSLYAETARKQIDVDNSVPPDTIATGDANRVYQVIYNILANAVKFTPKAGMVKISAAPDAEPGFVLVSVADSGVGVPEEFAREIFNANIKTSSLGTDHERGTGLGLPLCKAVIDRHGGKIWHEKNSPNGTIFMFTLPSS